MQNNPVPQGTPKKNVNTSQPSLKIKIPEDRKKKIIKEVESKPVKKQPGIIEKARSTLTETLDRVEKKQEPVEEEVTEPSPWLMQAQEELNKLQEDGTVERQLGEQEPQKQRREVSIPSPDFNTFADTDRLLTNLNLAAELAATGERLIQLAQKLTEDNQMMMEKLAISSESPKEDTVLPERENINEEINIDSITDTIPETDSDEAVRTSVDDNEEKPTYVEDDTAAPDKDNEVGDATNETDDNGPTDIDTSSENNDERTIEELFALVVEEENNLFDEE